MARLFCFGFGYSAAALAHALRAEGWSVVGTCRSEAKAAEMRAAGIEALLFDDGQPLRQPAAALAGATHLLVSTPPGRDGDPVLAMHGADIAAMVPPLQWIGYLSTTGVYGDHGGAWVDEDTLPMPQTPRAKARLDAEQGWAALGARCGVAVDIFRLAGIYGPGRSAIDSLRAGTARRIDKPGQWFSRIHVADIAGALQAAIQRPRGGTHVYNLCDDLPAAGHEVIAYAAALLGIAPPPLEPYEQANLTGMAASFYADNKRVSNRRIKQELGLELRYPDYRRGLAGLLAAPTTQS